MFTHVPLSQIEPNPYQSRIDYGAIDELAENIQSQLGTYPGSSGLLQVPTARAILTNDKYPNGKILTPTEIILRTQNARLKYEPGLRVELAFGHRRKRAFDHLHANGAIGYEGGTMPLIIHPLSNEQMLDAVWGENSDRLDITAIDRALLIQKKLEQVKDRPSGGSQRDVADAWGLSRPTIANCLRLLQLPHDIQQANREGRLTERQCLALLPICQIKPHLRPTLRWGTGDYYHSPQEPDQFIQRVIADGLSSEDIRKYLKKLLAHAGETIPDVMITIAFDSLKQAQKATCSGCKYRHQEYCLMPGCLRLKKEALIERRLQEISAQTGYPRSTNKDDFPTSYGFIHEIKALHQAGIKANFVIRWQSGNGYYPWNGNPHDITGYMPESSLYKNDGYNGIALGHHGDIKPFLAQLPTDTITKPTSKKAQVADVTEQQIETWEKEVRQLGTDATKQLVQILVAEFKQRPAYVLQLLLKKPDDEWINDPDKALNQAIKKLTEQSRWLRHSDTHLKLRDIRIMLKAGGLSSTPAPYSDNSVETLTAVGKMALNLWIKANEYSWYVETAMPHIEGILKRFDEANHPELETMRRQLEQAVERGQQILKEIKTS